MGFLMMSCMCKDDEERFTQFSDYCKDTNWSIMPHAHHVKMLEALCSANLDIVSTRFANLNFPLLRRAGAHSSENAFSTPSAACDDDRSDTQSLVSVGTGSLRVKHRFL